ncbi:hypothetical protein, partial [Wenzhouxiangella sp. XN201]|uniref:hypothetical protein n=1 Tax=Wenzhouxiangella sp. XN201 TaxID=2710755 RepID=UPI001969EEA9
SYIGEVAGDWITPALTMNLLGITTLLGFFLPGLMAGFLAHERPLAIGSGLGLIVAILYFSLSVIFLGWDWAVAGIRLSPAAIPTLFALTFVFTYGGYTAAQRMKRSN